MRPFLLPPLRALLYAHWMATHFSAALYPMRSLPKRSSSTPAGRYLLHKLTALPLPRRGATSPPSTRNAFIHALVHTLAAPALASVEPAVVVTQQRLPRSPRAPELPAFPLCLLGAARYALSRMSGVVLVRSEADSGRTTYGTSSGTSSQSRRTATPPDRRKELRRPPWAWPEVLHSGLAAGSRGFASVEDGRAWLACLG